MVCAKKTKSAAAVVATAASSVYQSYNGSGASPVATGSAGVLANNSSVKTLSTTTSTTSSGIKGFNYGAFFMDYTAKKEADFEYEFQRAQDLDNTSGWTSARLYTMSEYLNPIFKPDSQKIVAGRQGDFL